MPTYITLIHWTDQGARAASKSLGRYREAKTAFEKLGVTFQGIWWTTGQYDIVTVLQAPDEETLSTALLQLAAAGNLRTESFRAFTEDEAQQIFSKLG